MSKTRRHVPATEVVGDKQRQLTRLSLSEIRPIPRRGLSRVEASMYVGISPSKFDELRNDGRIGPPRMIDGRRVWDVHDLDRWFEAFPVEGSETDEDWNAAV
jgi:hypothetical protein